MYTQLNENQTKHNAPDTMSPKTSSSSSITITTTTTTTTAAAAAAKTASGGGVVGMKSSRQKMNNNLELKKSLMDDNDDIERNIVMKSFNSNNNYDNDNDGDNNNNMDDDDPFYVFKEDLLMKLELMNDGLDTFERVVQITDTAVNIHEVKEAKKQLKRHIKNAESTLKDLRTTIQLVTKNRSNFPNIHDAELRHRQLFLSSTSDKIKYAKKQMHSDRIKSKLLADEKAKSRRRLGILGAKSNDDDYYDHNGVGEDEETEFIKSHAGTQLMMRHQDETLDELDDAVVRVGYMAENIHEELEQQNKYLTELEEDLTNAEEQLGVVMGRMAKILKTKNKWHLGTILIMSFIVVILFFMVLYT